MNPVLAGQLRAVLAASGGVFTALGFVDASTVATVTEQATTAINAAMTLFGAGQIIVAAVWSWWEKKKAAKAS